MTGDVDKFFIQEDTEGTTITEIEQESVQEIEPRLMKTTSGRHLITTE